jgi:DNA-binding winged helix-turn-helix (wHTH) protein/Tol biopolymer transport system component
MTIAVKHLLEFGPFRIDPEQRLLWRGQEPIPLSPKAFELLLVLAQRSGQVVLKDELMSLLWPDTFVEESNLGQHIFQLRKALGERAQDPSYIVTVPGRGYRFVHGVRTIPAKPDEEIVLETHSRSRLVIEQEEGLADRSPASATQHRRLLLVTLAVAVALLLGAAVLLLSYSPAPKVLSVRQITHTGRVEPYGKILTDGQRLYFTERRGGIEALAQVPVAGGEPELVSTTIPSLMLDDIDPDRSRLLVATQGAHFDEPLWIVPTGGGSARRVGDLLASAATVWSPDGRRIIYGHDAQILTVGEDGEQPVKLLTAPGYVISLRPAPDGKRLRFTVRDSGSAGTHLWESSADGSNPHPMSFGWKTAAPQWGEGESAGDWTPDGRYFVFRAAHDGVEGLWAIRENAAWFRWGSSTPIQLYSSPDRIGAPQFSPDGKKIFFTIYRERRELVRYDSAQKTFVPYMGGIPARLLSFSRDGKWVTYRSDTDGSLWRSRPDGTEKLQLTFLPMVAYHSTWSPDGKRIVFGATLPGQAARLYAVSPDGGTPEQLTASNDTDGEPSYSPHGQFIIFQRWTKNQEGTRHSAIYILDMNTRQVRELPGTTDYDGVHWSHDGKYSTATDEANNRLMLYDFERQRWSVLADGAAYGWGIRWSSDSRYVYYQHSQQGEEQPIFRVRVSDRKVEQITSARQILRADVLGYSMTGLTPDNSPLASLIQRDSDIYALEIELP